MGIIENRDQFNIARTERGREIADYVRRRIDMFNDFLDRINFVNAPNQSCIVNDAQIYMLVNAADTLAEQETKHHKRTLPHELPEALAQALNKLYGKSTGYWHGH